MRQNVEQHNETHSLRIMRQNLEHHNETQFENNETEFRAA